MMGSSDDEMTRLWKATKLIVEANSYERMTLWERWVDKTEWQQHLQDHLVTVGTYRNRPVCVSFVWATIRGKVVLFLEATSELVDWTMIDALVEVIAAAASRRHASNSPRSRPSAAFKAASRSILVGTTAAFASSSSGSPYVSKTRRR